MPGLTKQYVLTNGKDLDLELLELRYYFYYRDYQGRVENVWMVVVAGGWVFR